MRKIYLMLAGLCLSCNLYADTMLNGEDMNKTVLTIKKKLKFPRIISENISATNMYAEDNKYVVTEYTYDKPIFENKMVEARKNTKKNMLDTICYEEKARNVLFGDNKKNIIKGKHIYKGKIMFEETITYEECKKINK